jgi:hypothetical protein
LPQWGRRSLHDETSGDGGSEHGRPAHGLEHGLHTGSGAVGVGIGKGGIVGEGAVDEDGAASLVVGDVNDRLVQGSVGSVADELVKDGVALATVLGLVARAGGLVGAAAQDRLGLLLVGGLVEEAVLIPVAVRVDAAAVPGAGPEGVRGDSDQGEGSDETDWADASGLVWCAGAAAVETAARAEARLGA